MFLRLVFFAGFICLVGCKAVSLSYPHSIIVRNTNKFEDYSFFATNNKTPIVFNGEVIINDSTPIGLYAVKIDTKQSTDTLFLNNGVLVKEFFIKNIGENKVLGNLKLYDDAIISLADFNKNNAMYYQDIAYGNKGNKFLFTAIAIIILMALLVFYFNYKNKTEVKIPMTEVDGNIELN